MWAGFTLALAAPLAAQDFELTVANIMRGPELIGSAPSGLGGFGFGGGGFSWSPDSRYIYFRWEQPGIDTAAVVYRIRPGDDEPERLEGFDTDTLLIGSGIRTRDGRRALYSRQGDIVIREGNDVRQVTKTRSSESGGKWSDDERSVLFNRGGQVFRLNLETALLEQLTDIRQGNGPQDDSEATGQKQFLVEQQEALFEVVRDGHLDGQPWNRSAAPNDSSLPRPFYPGQGKSVGGLQVTPDGKFVLMSIREPARDGQRIKLPLWITDDGYLGVYEGRTKVGDAQGTSRAAILEVATGAVTFVGDSVGEGDRSISGVAVSPNSQHALVRVTTDNDEDRWYVVVDLPSMETRVVHHDHDDAWLGRLMGGTAGFLPDGETVYFGSEQSGFAHLYTVSAQGGTPTALTSGEWEVLGARMSPDRREWYVTANKEGFADVHHYTMPIGGGELTRVTSAPGRQNVSVSPDGRWLAISHSEANHPAELYIQENRAGRDMRKITESTSEEWQRGDWIKPEIVMITARDGVQVPARLYRPKGNVAPAGERPAVVFVHGAGYLQNVHNWWSNYYREYMFHHLLASRGYTVLDMDYRGSAGHGRDWRTAIYEHMGGKDLTDNVDGARWLIEEMGIHPNRIGLYGGSYGGFIALMAMFTTPGVFEAGAALRPVTDWAHYNDGYTSNILNDPQEDVDAYERSSPIYFADGLEGHLLMAHGMVDDNVLFYDTVRLAQRLIELGKENWEVAIYPAERHSFQHATSWTDEYRRILKLFEDNLR
jgi:dipeptidyl aminopeptidase/acylaminoacyl peptidase